MATQNHLPMRHIAHDRDGDVQRTLGGVSANQFASMGICQIKQSLGKAGQPIFVNPWQ